MINPRIAELLSEAEAEERDARSYETGSERARIKGDIGTAESWGTLADQARARAEDIRAKVATLRRAAKRRV